MDIVSRAVKEKLPIFKETAIIMHLSHLFSQSFFTNLMVFIRFPVQVPGISAPGQRKAARDTGTELLRELGVGPCSEDRDSGLDESGDDNLLHTKRVYQ